MIARQDYYNELADQAHREAQSHARSSKYHMAVAALCWALTGVGYRLAEIANAIRDSQR